MNDTISRQQAIEHLKKRLYESALNNDGIASEIMEEIADNRIQIWMDELPPSPSIKPDSDTISRQAVLDAVDTITKWSLLDRNGCHVGVGMKYRDVKETVKSLPPSPSRPKGKWIPQNLNKSDGMISTAVYYYPKCSVCGANANYTNFCPNCGAEMLTEGDNIEESTYDRGYNQ